MRKNKKTLFTCLLAVLALSLGVVFAKPAFKAQAEETILSTENWTLVVENDGADFRVQNGNEYWTTYTNSVTPASILDYAEINGKTLSEINAEHPGAIQVTLQPAGGAIGSFFRVNINRDVAGFSAYDMATFVVRAGWSHTDENATYKIDTDLYFAHAQNKTPNDSNNWKHIPVSNVVDITDDIQLQDQGIQFPGTRAILISTSNKNYWTADPATPNEGGGAFLNLLSINGTTIKEWNNQAHAKLNAGEITDISYGSDFWLIDNGPVYAPIAMSNSNYTEDYGSLAQVWIPTNYIPNVSSFKVSKGFANLQGDTLYYVSKDVECVKSGREFKKVSSSVDITDAFKLLVQDYTSSDGTMLYYIHTNNVKYWNQQYGSEGGYAINEGEWKGVEDTSLQGGAVQMSYIEFNGTPVYDINASDNGAYGATQETIAKGSKYAPILAFLTPQELGNAIKLQVPSAYPSGSGVAKDNHKTITIKKGFYVLDTSTNIKYEVTKDVQWDYVDGQWVEHVNLIETNVTMAKVFIGEDGSAFAGVQLAGSDYESASSTYAGTAKTALSYAQSANFLSHVLIDDEQLAKPGEAFLNVWGKKGYFTFRPGNNSATKITILAGCQFPTYIALETGAKEAYVTTEDITFVKEGENWVQQVETEFNLEAYKTKKIAELQAYKQGEVESEEERLSLVSKATTSISRATDKERVDTVVASIKVKIDELPAKPDDSEILNPLKDDAKAQLDAYLADGDYSGLQVIDRNSAITKGKVLIENAGNEQAVIDALAQAKALVDSALNREVNYVDVTAVIKVTNEHKPNGNFNVYVVFAGVDAVAGDHTYDVKIGDVLSALGFWDNVVVAGKTLTEWGVTGGWNEDNVIGYNVGEPLNNVRILCHSEDWKTSDVEFASSIVSNYEMTIKEGTLIPSQAYFTGADTYDVYRVQLEMNSVDEAIAYSFKGYAETDVVSVKLAEESEVTHLALDFSNDDFPTEGGAVDFPDWYFGDEYNLNGYWVKVKVNGGNGIGKLAKFNLNEGGRGAFAIEVDMPYDQISSITIPAGTIFPTYAFLNLPALNNDNKLVVVLKTAKDVTFVKLEDGSWISVDAYRADALATLADAKAGYAEENYFEADFEALVEAYESGVELINNATTIEDIDSALEQAIALLEVVPTKAVVIEAAKEEISAYKEGLFREAEEAQRLAIVAEAQATFDTCGSEEAVANALADAKAEVDALKTAAEYADEELAEVKAEAREQIANYLDKANYYADEQAEIDRAIEAGHDLVAQATNEVEIAQAVVDAKALLDAIYTQEEVRENVKADLSAYKAEDVFRVEEQAQRDAIVEKALADLEGLTDLAEINSIVEKAYEDIDALTTNDEYIEAELALLKADAKAEIEAYLADRDYIPSQERYRAEAIEDAMKALEKAKSEDAINQVVEEAKANLDGIAKMATIVDTAMMVRITDINHAGGNLNMFIIIPGLDVGTAGDGLSFDYSKESLEALFDEFGLYDMIYINDKSLRDWGFVGFWNGSLGFNVDGPSPHIYLHMHTDNPEYAAAVESGEITFTKYKDTDGDGIGDTLDIKQSAVSVDKGLLIPGYAFLSEEENAVVYRLSTDVVTRGEHRPYDLETRAYTNVDSVAYVQEDIIDDEFKGGYFGISLEGDDFPAFEGDHSIVLEGMRNYANYDRILINGEAGHVDKYALFNRGENGKGRISIAIDVSSEDMKSITIPAGTTFPAYSPVLLQPHNNNNIIFIYFETTTDVTFIKLDNGEWIKFEDYVQSAKDAIGELKAEKEALDCFAADMTLIANTYADAMTALDNATEAEEVKATLANALEVLGAIQSKVDVIANAKAELDAYKADSFLEAEDAQRAEAVADAKTAIETANSSAEVANIVASTKEFIDTLKTANEYAKEAIAEEVAEAKAELDAYKAEDGLYREEEVAARLAIIEDAKLALDEALDLDTVAEIVANAKADIDELKTDAELSEEERLAGVKEDAIKAINAKKASIDLTLYSEDAVLTISTLYNEAKLAIESATSDDEIADIVAQFSEDVDAVPQLGEEPESSESESSQESTSEAITGGCLGNIGGLSSVFALLSVMAVAVVIKKRR